MQKKGEAKAVDLLEQFKPRHETDLAIHVRKIEEVKQWLTAAGKMHPATQMLLVTGPSGSGKYVCVKTLATGMGYDVAEWTSPVDVELFFDDRYDFDGTEERKGRRPQKALFDEFLYKTSRYCSLFSSGTSGGKLLLVKDFPNSMLRNREEFHESLDRFRDRSAVPIVFIATDTASKGLDIAYNLFPPAIMENFQIHQIKFNTVSATLLKKALKRISAIITEDVEMSKLYQAIPSKATEDEIVTSSQGDLRNCCLNFLFTCMKNTEAEPLAKRPRLDDAHTRVKDSQNGLGLNEGLTMMHGLGRIFHPKFVKTAGDVRFLHSPESITECFASQPSTMIALLHSNYVTRCSDVQHLSTAADTLTLVDAITNEYRSDLLALCGLNIAIRSMMVNNEQTAHGRQQIKKKISVQLQQSVTSFAEELNKTGVILRPVPSRVFATEYNGYVSIIQKH